MITRHEPQRGSGTVLASGLGLLVLIMLSGLVLLVQAAVCATKAASAADLAALAAADAAREISTGDPCSVAAMVAAQNQVQLQSCQRGGLNGTIVLVTTSVPLPAPLGAATGRSRAGPPP
jgi:secretion/DNA translocation related TadE-like protein